MADEVDFVKGASGPANPYDTSATGLGVSPTYLASSTASSTSTAAGLPVGAVSDYAGAGAPAGWVLCDGSSYPRTGGTYDDLFAAIGTTYGAADGTHFNVPDTRGRATVGVGTHADVSSLGNSEGSTVANRRPKHPHTDTLTYTTTYQVKATLNDSTGNAYALFPFSGGNDGTVPTNKSGSVGVAGTASDTGAYLVMNKIIKL